MLSVRDPRGRELAAVDLPDGRFSHVFIHSFHLTPVEERIELVPGGFRLYELRYESCGVGMPADAEGGYRLEDGVFVLDMDRRFKKIPIMVSVLPGHGIIAGDAYLPFRNWARPEDTLVLQPRTKTTLRFRR